MLSRRAPATVGSPRRRPRAIPGDASPGRISVATAIARYPGEWILMGVTARDDDGWPTEGDVLAHNPSRQKVGKIRAHLLQGSEPLIGPLYLFDGYPLLQTGDDVRSALEPAAEPSGASRA
jgi:hypothetical protein